MDRGFLESKVDSLLRDLKKYIETTSLSENEIHELKTEIDKLLYECLYYKTRLLS
ncbi:MAG: hypothetical protein N3I35_00535 [Clostridia bacterium]|nr:hypothetical protein [Clostridia bacterium]